MIILANLLTELNFTTTANISLWEAVMLLVLAAGAFCLRKRVVWLPLLYTIFLIVYITVLRRAPGYDEHIRIHFVFWTIGTWVGHLLNVLLYVPFGTAGMQLRKFPWWSIITGGAVLSMCCEAVQFLSKRGWADINDILFNTLGTAAGAVLMILWNRRKNHE